MRRILDRGADPAIGSTAAQIAGHRGIDVGVGRMPLGLQQSERSHDLSGLAIAALNHIVADPRLLDRAPDPVRGDRLDRRDVAAGWADTGNEQERTALPFKCTVHAPQAATPQPNLVPVSLSSSRITQSSGVSSGAS